MSKNETVEPKQKTDGTPRLVCAFSGFFALAVPAFSVIVGARLHPALTEVVARGVRADGDAAIAGTILDVCEPTSWILLTIGVIAAISLFALMRKNSTAGTLVGAGRISLLLTLTGALSAFYLAALLFAAAFAA